MITYSENYLYGFETTEIDNRAFYNECLRFENVLKDKFPSVEKDWYGNMSSALNQKYNFFTFPSKYTIQLYHLLKNNVNDLLDKKTSYAIKSWMNVYREGDQVSMHMHWPSEFKVWHGFYCVNVGEKLSETIYKIPHVKDEIHIESKNGLIVFGKSDGDEHRSSVWTEKDYCRITLAFDIVPVENLKINHINHYIPFKV